jgi:hypothetical protein
MVQPSIWSGFKTVLSSIFSTVVTASSTVEKATNLVEREVDGLATLQDIRFDVIKADRDAQRKLLELI